MSLFPFDLAGPVARSSSSNSTERSQSVIWSSAPEAAKEESSVGCHSMEVMGAVCHEKEATGVGDPELELSLGGGIGEGNVA